MRHNIRPSEIANADETATYVATPPLHQFVDSEHQERASAPDAESKMRFTTMLLVKGDGEMCPSFHIIRCSINRPDLTSSTVLKSLHKTEGYRPADGWTYAIWEKDIALRVKGSKQRETKKWYSLFVITNHQLSYSIHTITIGLSRI